MSKIYVAGEEFTQTELYVKICWQLYFCKYYFDRGIPTCFRIMIYAERLIDAYRRSGGARKFALECYMEWRI